MELEKFKAAKRLREKIEHIEIKMLQVQKMKMREDDVEFNECRQLAYDSMDAFKEKLEVQFKEL